MTVLQLRKFCAPRGFHPTAQWLEEPFRIDNWQIATNGHVLIAAYGKRHLTQLATLEKCANRDMITEWLELQIPEQKYSTEDLKAFLDSNAYQEPPELLSSPMVFNGYRIDGNYVRKVFALTNEPYRFSIVDLSGGGRIHFRFNKVIALVMGMREISELDPRYEPKPLQVNQPQTVLR